MNDKAGHYAFEDPSGNISWHRKGQLHRTDGPAIEYADGTGRWYVAGELVHDAECPKDAPSHLVREVLTVWTVDGPSVADLLAALTATEA